MALKPWILRFIAESRGLDLYSRGFTSDYFSAVGREVDDTAEAKKKTLSRLRDRDPLEPLQPHPAHAWLWIDLARAIGFTESLIPFWADFISKEENSPERRRAAVALYRAAQRVAGVDAWYTQGVALLHIGSETPITLANEPAVASLAKDLGEPVAEWPRLALARFERAIEKADQILKPALTYDDRRFLLRARIGRVSALVQLTRATRKDLVESAWLKRRMLILGPSDVTMGVSGLYSAAFLAIEMESQRRAEGMLLVFARRLAQVGFTDLEGMMYHGRKIKNGDIEKEIKSQMDAWIWATLERHGVLIDGRLTFPQRARIRKSPPPPLV